MGDDIFGLAGQTLEGKYAIERVVAQGGFGVVYKGQHKTLDKSVAVKVLKVPAEFSPTARQAFLQSFTTEAQTIARLEHPAIVRVLDFGVSVMPAAGEAPWMVLEWLTGVTLEDDLKMRRAAGGSSPKACFDVMRPVLEAVATAHEGGIAHRDIKPANVMLLGGPETLSGSMSGSSRRGAAQVRLLDFGIAKVMKPDETGTSGQTRTQAALLAFSLPYAAPEQVSATRTGPWTDVHALALILTEMLTAERPYGSGDAMEVHLQVLGNQRPTPAKFGVDVGQWEPVLLRALAIRPADRFQNAGELLDALETALPGATHHRVAAAGGGVVAATAFAAAPATAPVSTLTPVTNPHAPANVAARRRPVLIGAGIAAVVVGLLGTGAFVALRGERDASPATLSPPARPAAAPAVPAAPAALEAAPGSRPAEVVPTVPAATAPVAAAAPVIAAAPVESGGRSGRRRRHRGRERESAGGAPVMVVAPQSAAVGHRQVGVE